MRYFITALFAILLSACGGGGGAATGIQIRSVQLFGDSTMDQAGPLIAAALSPLTVINSARSGSTSTMLLEGTDRVIEPCCQSANAQWPQSIGAALVVINHGMNDSQKDLIGPPYGITVQAYKENLRELIRRANTRVVLQTPNPSFRRDVDSAPYAQAMREVGAEMGVYVIDVHAFVSSIPGWENLIPDGVHPSDAGMRRIVGELIAPELRKLL